MVGYRSWRVACTGAPHGEGAERSMTRKRAAIGLVFTAAALGVACGGDSNGDDVFKGDGAAGTSAGGTAGSGGSAGAGAMGGSAGSGATGGSAGASGGAAGAGGLGGSAGALDAGPACAPPSTSSTAAVCLHFAPEAMTFGSTADLDGQGILVVEVFNVADPEPEGGPSVSPIAQQIFPAQAPDAGGAEVSLDALPSIRFEALPTTVYVRAFFIDNALTFALDTLLWGTWIGGLDLSAGLTESTPLDTVSLVAGQGTNLTVPMTAFRKLEVGITASATPLDDGEGPLGWVAFDSATPDETSSIFGIGQARCRDVSGGRTARVTGVVIGGGDHWLFSQLDDFNLDTGDTPPGALISIDLSGSTPRLPAANRVTFGATQYSATATIDLNEVNPLDPDAGTPPGFSCSMIRDAGAD